MSTQYKDEKQFKIVGYCVEEGQINRTENTIYHRKNLNTLENMQ